MRSLSCAINCDKSSVVTCVVCAVYGMCQTLIMMSILVAICTAPINLLNDFLFTEIITAPTADDSKVLQDHLQNGGMASRALRRTSAALRRASAASVQAVTRAKSSLSDRFNVRSTLDVPKATIRAQARATVLSKDLVKNMRMTIESNSDMHQESRKESLEVLRQRHELRLTAMRRHERDHPLNDQLMELELDLAEQRRLLKPSLRESFDMKWGYEIYALLRLSYIVVSNAFISFSINPVGEFHTHHESMWLCGSTKKSTVALLLGEMEAVKKEADAKIAKLRLASDAQIGGYYNGPYHEFLADKCDACAGVEILHMFVLDILGRDSRVAKIFERKSEEE